MTPLANVQGQYEGIFMSLEPTSIIFIWQSLVARSYRSFFEKLSEITGTTPLTLISPKSFVELGSQNVASPPFSYPFDGSKGHLSAYRLGTIVFHVQIVFYVGLLGVFLKLRNNAKTVVVCSMSEPYAVTTFLHYLVARLVFGKKLRFVFFALQNIHKKFPRPLMHIQSFVLKRAHLALALGAEHEQVLRRQGYQGLVQRFPLWFDSTKYRCTIRPDFNGGIRFGYIGSLTEAKGIFDLMKAFDIAAPGSGSLKIAGKGPLSNIVKDWCFETTQVATRQKSSFCADYVGPLVDADIVGFYANIDVLIVPSKTTPNWKEQFGRVIIEAWACGCLVIGSDSGEIPFLIDSSDHIFPEGDTEALAKIISNQLAQWQNTPTDTKLINAKTLSNKAHRQFSDHALASRFYQDLMSNLNILH
jgi:glycosyltransferase involved in cell wall biosynthesis